MTLSPRAGDEGWLPHWMETSLYLPTLPICMAC